MFVGLFLTLSKSRKWHLQEKYDMNHYNFPKISEPLDGGWEFWKPAQSDFSSLETG